MNSKRAPATTPLSLFKPAFFEPGNRQQHGASLQTLQFQKMHLSIVLPDSSLFLSFVCPDESYGAMRSVICIAKTFARLVAHCTATWAEAATRKKVSV